MRVDDGATLAGFGGTSVAIAAPAKRTQLNVPTRFVRNTRSNTAKSKVAPQH